MSFLKRLTSIITMFLFVGAVVTILGVSGASACGYGNSGGGDYVPQKQNPYGSQSAAYALGSDQVENIVSDHISKLNPDLSVGEINDAGGFFEVEIKNQDNEIVQILGVDKFSGRLMLLN